MVALGATVQVSLPPPKRFDRPRLIVPATAVSDILGKKAARAAPMLALAARSRLSASAMSGRRNNIVESRFPGNCAIVEPFGDSPVGNSSKGHVDRKSVGSGHDGPVRRERDGLGNINKKQIDS